ncbi:MAG: hypothetical protein IPK76_22725 [Lewinellaceae bacterium]|nr:hypothetical protein [Lewinellaceae bacterium]
MKSSLNFKHFLALPLLFAVSASFAQNEIQGTQTDETYGNTTVIYTKDKSANDAAILAQLDNSLRHRRCGTHHRCSAEPRCI